MKKIILSLTLVLIALVVTSSAYSQSAERKIKIGVSGKVHKPSQDCKKKFGLCDFGISVTFERGATGYIDMDAIIENGQLVIDFKSDLSTNPSYMDDDLTTLIIDEGEEYIVNKETSQKLGVNNLTILKGNYTVDYKTNKFGTVKLDIKTD